MKYLKNNYFVYLLALLVVLAHQIIFQDLARALPLVHIFEEARNILVNKVVNYESIITAFKLNLIYLIAGIFLFYYSFSQARKKGSLINIGE